MVFLCALCELERSGREIKRGSTLKRENSHWKIFGKDAPGNREGESGWSMSSLCKRDLVLVAKRLFKSIFATDKTDEYRQ
jgi:hypothetical protein